MILKILSLNDILGRVNTEHSVNVYCNILRKNKHLSFIIIQQILIQF